MRILVFGAGGVGGYFGGRLAQAGENVWFIARGKHLTAMRKGGLTVHASDGDFHIPPGTMTDSVLEAGTPDVVLLCVKAYDTETAAEALNPILNDQSVIISLQNGVENEEKIGRIVRTGTIYGGAAYIFANITEPGCITEWGGPRKIVFGPMDGILTHRAREIEDLMKKAGIDVRLSDDIRTELWKKFIFIAAAGGFVTLTRLTFADVMEVEECRRLMHDAMTEAEQIARAKGIAIRPGFAEKQLDALKSNAAAAWTSMHHDLVNEKPLEIEDLAGAIVRYGRELGIPTPVNSTIYAGLLPHHLLHLKKLGPRKL